MRRDRRYGMVRIGTPLNLDQDFHALNFLNKFKYEHLFEGKKEPDMEQKFQQMLNESNVETSRELKETRREVLEQKAELARLYQILQ
jgi:hypothetical protein